MNTGYIRTIKKNKCDKVFLLYFTIMAVLYTRTYIQLAAQLGIIAYVGYVMYFKASPLKRRVGYKNVKFLLIWFGLFTAFAMVSKFWAYGTKDGRNTLLILFRITAIGIALFLYVIDYNKAVSVIKSFIYSNVIMALVVLVVTPLSQYGKAGEDGFGNIIGQQRNTFGAAMAFLVLICIVFYQKEGLKSGKILAAFFVLMVLCSGSRGAMLQLVIIAAFYVVLMPGLTKKFKYIFIALLCCIVAYFMLQSIPYLYETVWVRFENMFSSVIGVQQDADGSSMARELYKVLAYDMFLQKPVFGFGVDGFYCYLADVGYINGYSVSPVSSHCNFAEIAANFGIVGLAIWYIPVICVLWDSYKKRNRSYQMKMVFIILASMVILDYARIPWVNHLGTYSYLCIFLIYLTTKQKMVRNRYQSELGSL